MTDYEIIMILLGILALLVSFGSLLVALLAYIDRKKSENKNAYPVVTRIGGAHQSTF